MTAAENKKIIKGRNGSQLNTQTMIPISELRGNTLLMNDGGMRGVVGVQGLNIDLKNYDEQVQVVEQYKRFLNGLDFPIQIVVRNTYLDLTDYSEYLKKNVSSIDNHTLKHQGEKFIQFIDEINIQQGLIYVKEFYVIVPYYEADDHKYIRRGWFKKFLDALNTTVTPEQVVKNRRSFIKNEKMLATRCNIVVEGLKALGISAHRLKTPAIAELLFKYYNPSVHDNMAPQSK